ncbi:MAG: DUF3343 domain-containing protein [Defluviitaleaceae bacterium]|nr:DUF3343 domain-containing protein [Defluviitaleaceae bacterium]
MDNYIATFFSHFDALMFCEHLKEQGVAAKMMPVPRKVSSSCGTCVSFTTETEINFDQHEVDAVFVETFGEFRQIA